MDEELCLKFCREEQYAKTHAEISFFGSFLNRTLQFKDMLWPVRDIIFDSGKDFEHYIPYIIYGINI